MTRELDICVYKDVRIKKTQGFAVKNKENEPYYTLFQCIDIKKKLL